MKYQAFSPANTVSRARPVVGLPMVGQGTQQAEADGATILQGSISEVRRQAKQLQRGRPFNIPKIEVWEQELSPENFPLSHGRARVIILSGKDVFSFCQSFNQGSPVRQEEPQKTSPIRRLLEWLFPRLQRERAQKQVKESIRRQDELIQNIKRFVAEQKGLEPLPDLGTSQPGTHRTGLLTYLKLE